MNSEVEPPQKKRKKTNPTPLFFLSLPDEIVINCLARISRSYYPKLSLVSKTFRSFVLSDDLMVTRLQLKTDEEIFNVCLQFPDSPSPSWYSLWIKPDQALTNDLKEKKKKSKKKKKSSSTGNTLLVQIPSSHYYYEPMFAVTVGSELYGLSQNNAPSCVLWVGDNKKSFDWREASSMIVARESAVACVLDKKIYVMGGCDESANWAEVFDTKTQTWELLPDPGPEIRFSSIRKIDVIDRKLYIRSNNKNNDYVYDPNEGKWDIAPIVFVTCMIEDVWYSCDKQSCWWYDTKHQEWRVVRGLAILNRNRRSGMIEIANYGGKLLILWDKFEHPGCCQFKDIWCAVIALEKRNNGDEIWGNIEWANVVGKVPSSYVFVRSLVSPV